MSESVSQNAGKVPVSCEGALIGVSLLCLLLGFGVACAPASGPEEASQGAEAKESASSAVVTPEPADALNSPSAESAATAGEAPAAERDGNSVFSGAQAAAHEQSLGAFRPRIPGSPAAEDARSYLVQTFIGAGARVWEVRDRQARHLMAEIKGASSDWILIAAPFSLVAPDDWIGDSGPALLLEIARVLGDQSLPYTIRFALAETTGLDPRTSLLAEPRGRGPETSGAARDRVVAAGLSLARALGRAEAASPRPVLRGVIAFDASARADLRLARDIRSHPVFRDLVWGAARRLGETQIFPSESGWSSPRSLHLGLQSAARGKVLALVDETWTRPEEAGTRRDAPAPATFEGAGRVLVESLNQLMSRLARIDAFGE